MCTVTIVPTFSTDGSTPDGFCMACSRDEQHGRSPALAPQVRHIAGQRVLMPIDPGSDGTWVGVNEAGLAITLLNYNLPDPPTGRDQSRGQVIPALLGSHTIDELLTHAADIQSDRMLPFRLLVCDGRSLMVWRSTEPIGRVRVDAWDHLPVMLTSSGLGDHRVEGPRRKLFEGWFGEDATAYVPLQQAFHRHSWPGREHLSICMQREDARTVSYTTLQVDPQQITMTYHPDRPDRAADDVTLTLERRMARR